MAVAMVAALLEVKFEPALFRGQRETSNRDFLGDELRSLCVLGGAESRALALQGLAGT